MAEGSEVAFKVGQVALGVSRFGQACGQSLLAGTDAGVDVGALPLESGGALLVVRRGGFRLGHGRLRRLPLRAKFVPFTAVLVEGVVQLLRREGLAADGAEGFALRVGEGGLTILQVLGTGAVAAGLAGARGLEALGCDGRLALALDFGIDLGEALPFLLEPRLLRAENRQPRDEHHPALAFGIEPLDARVEAGALLGDLAVGHGDGVFDRPCLGGEGGEGALFVAGLPEAAVGRFNAGRVLERPLYGREVGFERRDSLRAALDVLLARFEEGRRLFHGAFAAIVFGSGDPEVAQLLLLLLEAEADAVAFADDLPEGGLHGGRFLQRLLVTLDLARLVAGFSLGGAAAIVGVPRELLVAVESEDLAQHLLAPRRGLRRELVRAALDEEDAVDEGLVVHVQAAGELGLRLAGGAAGDRPEVSQVIELEEIEGARAPPRALADDPVAVAVDLEVELDAHVGGAVVDAVVLDAAPRFTPEGPRDGVEEGGFAVAVSSREGGQLEAGEIELAVAVGEEVPQAQAAGNHGVASAGARRWACQRTPPASRSTTTATP